MTEETEQLEEIVEEVHEASEDFSSEDYDTGPEYDESSESEGEDQEDSKRNEKATKKYQSKKKNAKSKEKPSGLEEKVEASKTAARAFLKDNGYGEEEIDAMLGQVQSGDIEGFLDKLPIGLRSLAYIVFGFSEMESGKNVEEGHLKSLKRGETPYLFVAGLLNFPFSTRKLSKYSGINIIRIDSRDPDNIARAVNEAYERTGVKPVVMGFSLGGKNIAQYQQKYGSDNVSLFIGLDSEKMLNPKQGRSIYINGSEDLGWLDKMLNSTYWNPTSIQTYQVPSATHAGMCYSPRDIATIATIIKEETKNIVPTLKGSPFSYDTPKFRMKDAA